MSAQRFRLGSTTPPPTATPAAKPEVAPAKPASTPEPSQVAAAPSAEVERLKAEVEAANTAKTEAVAERDAIQGRIDTVVTARNEAIGKLNELAKQKKADDAQYNRVFNGRRMFFRLFLFALLAAIGLALYIAGRIPRKWRNIVATIVALVVLWLLIAPQHAGAATTVTVTSCLTPAPAPATGMLPAFFANDGSTSKVACTVSGLTAATAVTFSDANLTTANVSLTGNKLSFDLTVAAGATVPNEPDMSVNGIVVGHPIAVLDSTDAGKMDLTLRYLRGGSATPSGVDIHVRKLIEGMACGTDTSCLTDFRRKAWGSARGSSAEAGATLRVEIVEQTLSDPRLANATKAALDAFAANMPAVGVSESRAKEIAVEEAQTAVAPVHVRVDNIDARVTALDSRVGTVETGLSEARAEAATLRKALLSARVPRSGPAGFLGATRTLVPEPKPARAANAKKK